MGSKAEAIRQRIIDKADELFYRHGYENTSFSDIAKAVNISRGNFYYHFKTKDDILKEVIKIRLQSVRDMFNEWEQNTQDTRSLIHHFIDLMTHNQNNIQQYGCPVGTLCAELCKINHVMQNDATQIFSFFREWLITRFSRLGRKDDAEILAMQLLTRTQGLATMMSTFSDDKFYPIEIQALKDWLDEL